jgi:plastocyanin
MKKLIPTTLAFFLAAFSVVAAFGQNASAYAPSAPAACSERLVNGGFESGTTGWQVKTDGPGPVVTGAQPHTGAASAALGGRNSGQDELEQETSLPAGQAATFRFWWRMTTQEPTHPFDTLEVVVKRSGGQETLLTTITDGSIAGSWQQSMFDLSAYAGQSVKIKFTARTSDARPTTFYVDDVSLQSCSGATDTPTVTASPSATGTVTTTPTGSVTPDPSGTPTVTPTVSRTPTSTGSPDTRHLIVFSGGGFSYSPRDLSIRAGDEVEWDGPFAIHPLVSEDGLWTTVSSGDSFRFVFTKPGVYRYFCQFHGGPGGVGMSGVVRVGVQPRLYLPALLR